jgi:hypothetical protein
MPNYLLQPFITKITQFLDLTPVWTFFALSGVTNSSTLRRHHHDLTTTKYSHATRKRTCHLCNSAAVMPYSLFFTVVAILFRDGCCSWSENQMWSRWVTMQWWRRACWCFVSVCFALVVEETRVGLSRSCFDASVQARNAKRILTLKKCSAQWLNQTNFSTVTYGIV